MKLRLDLILFYLCVSFCVASPINAQESLAVKEREASEQLKRFRSDFLKARQRYNREWRKLAAGARKRGESPPPRAIFLPEDQLFSFVKGAQARGREFAGLDGAMPFQFWILYHAQRPGWGPYLERAVKTLIYQHIKTKKIVDLAPRISGSPYLKEEDKKRWLGVIEKDSPHAVVRNVARTYRLLADLENAKIDSAAYKEARKSALEAAAASGDFQITYQVRAVIGKREIRGPGDLAPDIVGRDLEHDSFKLSDSKGKIILLTFWSDLSPTSRGIYRPLRSLVKTMQDARAPFALIGVCADASLLDVQRAVKRRKINWRSFHGSSAAKSTINADWGIVDWPHFVVIDENMKIRHRGTRISEAVKIARQLTVSLQKGRK